VNALRVDYARSVGTQGKASAEASKAFLSRVDLARRDANIELIAADPACGETDAAKVRNVPRVEAREERGWLCVPPRWRPDPHTDFSLQPLGPELEPTLDLVAALTSYSEALAEIVEDEAPDPMRPLLDALATAGAVQSTIQAVSNRQGGPVPAVDDARVKAVGEFVGLLTELSHEAGQVKRIREVLRKHPRGAEPLIASLRADLEEWEQSRADDEVTRLAIVGAIRRRAIISRPPVPSAQRREAVTSYYNLQDAYSAAAKIHPALDVVLGELAAADANLRRVIVTNPRLTDKERARIAELNRQRIVRALERITALITAFRGA